MIGDMTAGMTGATQNMNLIPSPGEAPAARNGSVEAWDAISLIFWSDDIAAIQGL
jgi:hypothetical protein